MPAPFLFVDAERTSLLFVRFRQQHRVDFDSYISIVLRYDYYAERK